MSDSTVTFTYRVSYEETPVESSSDKIDSFHFCQEEHFSKSSTPTRIPLINNDFILNSVFQLEIKDLERVLKSKVSLADLTHNEINVFVLVSYFCYQRPFRKLELLGKK